MGASGVRVPGAAAPLGLGGVLPAAVDGDAVLRVLLHGGHQGAVPRRQGAQEAELALPHQVHDVVPEARGAQGHQRGVRAGAASCFLQGGKN